MLLRVLEQGRLLTGKALADLGNRLLAGDSHQALGVEGRFLVRCFDADGRLSWREEFPNTVVNVGKNLLLSTLMTGSAYTVTGPYMGLISNVSFTAISATDTMASHTGWLEAGNANAPTYGTTRPTCVWAAASGGSISLSAALNFTFTGNGTIDGAFIVLGTGASATVDNTSGTLFSAGLFTGGNQQVVSTQQVSVSYTLSV